MTALQDFQDGHTDGYRGNKRQKNRGGVYLRAYKRGQEAKYRDEFGDDLGDALRPKRKKLVTS